MPTLDVMTVRPATLDDLAEVKTLHATAFRTLSGSSTAEEHLEALGEYVNAPAYTEALMATNLLTAWADRMLVATAGWAPGNDRGATAKISDVFVHPLFKNIGIASELLRRQEEAAAAAGFVHFSASAPFGTTAFFERAGYHRTSQGVRALGGQAILPVTFLRKSHDPDAKPPTDDGELAEDTATSDRD